MQNFSISPKEMVACVWRNRGLTMSLVHREVVGRYQGSYMGIIWSFFNPVFMLAVYTFVFSVVFKARWGTAGESKSEFALILFAGLMVFNLFADCIKSAPELILANANYVKKVVFPLEILPWVTLAASCFHLIISLAVWILFYVVFIGAPKASLLMFPVTLIPLLILILGFSWILASLGVYLRDVSQMVGPVIAVLMFLSPIFYPIETLPEAYRGFIHLSPVALAVEQARNVMILGKGIDWNSWVKYLLVSLTIGWLGFAWFQKTRKGFADVL